MTEAKSRLVALLGSLAHPGASLLGRYRNGAVSRRDVEIAADAARRGRGTVALEPPETLPPLNTNQIRCACGMTLEFDHTPEELALLAIDGVEVSVGEHAFATSDDGTTLCVTRCPQVETGNRALLRIQVRR